jgi:hypothetical protein
VANVLGYTLSPVELFGRGLFLERKRCLLLDKKIFDCVIQEMKEEDEFSGVPLPD